jgi:hypothetical protein
MKNLRIVLFLFLSCTFFLAKSQAYKGLYVDGFDKILGNKVKEDSLLNYCKNNGFNALTTYKTKDIDKKIKLTNPKLGSRVLAAFIKRAKQNYGIVSFAMSSEQYATFRDVVARYNLTRKDTLEWVNALNFEFEYWHRKSTAPGGYYCKRYLEPANCSCDTSGAFSFYRKELMLIDSLAALLGIKFEVYVGKPTAGQALVIAKHVDRVLVDVYLKKPEKAFERASERIGYFAAANKNILIIPIWGSTDEFMGEWQRANKTDEAARIFLKDYRKGKSENWKNVSLAGFQWYKYSTMKK